MLTYASPQTFRRRLLDKLHFEGNKHEVFASTKFAGCLSEEAHPLDPHALHPLDPHALLC